MEGDGQVIKICRFLIKKFGNWRHFFQGPTAALSTYHDSPDLQMLLNLLAEKEGIWSALLILCMFDRNFRSEFRVRKFS